MHEIDKQYTLTPFYGKRRMAVVMQQKGFHVGPKKVRSLMEIMGLEAIYPKPHLSANNQAHKKYPYLLRGVTIVRPNQVWSSDITYIPLRGGFAYLVAIIDWYSRYVVDWELSNLLDTSFCLEALRRSMSKGWLPQIFNTDQGAQFTSEAFTGILLMAGIQISMDGRGRALDNIFIERLWRSLKYENVYPRNYETMKDAREGIEAYFNFYNNERVHQALGYQCPKAIYYA